MDKEYVSEFAVFMNHYLEDHPEVVEDQKRGWSFFWYPRIDLMALDKENEDIFPDDDYGFSSLFDAPDRKAKKRNLVETSEASQEARIH